MYKFGKGLDKRFSKTVHTNNKRTEDTSRDSLIRPVRIPLDTIWSEKRFILLEVSFGA